MSAQGVRDANEAAVPVPPAERFATPVMIPGAFEIRASPRSARPIQGPAVPVADHSSAVVAFDRERLEHQREGGGAPVAAGRLRALGTTLWRRFRR